jgi:NADH-quinone oxidoreductase subunit C
MSSEEKLASELKVALPGKILETKIPAKRRLFVTVPAEAYKEVVEHLNKKLGITHISTITGLDAGDNLEVLSHFFGHGIEITLKAAVPKSRPEIDSIVDIIPGAVLYEREVHDLLGITFKGHPNLARLILPEDWPEGVYPLRKDYKPQPPESLRKKE